MNHRQSKSRNCVASTLLFLLAIASAAILVRPVQGVEQEIEFSLKDHQGKVWDTAELADKKLLVIAFMGTECPLARLYAGRLEELADSFQKESVQFLMVNSNQQDSLAEIASCISREKITIPYLKDPGNRVADLMEAERTPEVFVLDENRLLAYRGKIDDQFTYGVQRAQADNHYLRDALEDILAGRAPAEKVTEPVGCVIGRVFTSEKSQEVTFANQISRILYENCVNCHREGEIAPFDLLDYDEVVGWAGMIAEVVEENRMPPWHASPDHGEFSNDARLSDEDKQLIQTWVENGAPLGDESQLPPKPEFADGWQIGEPDAVIKMRSRPYSVPATGTVPYRYFVVDTNFKEDKWIKAAECRPGAREVVHHIIVGIRGEGEFGRGGGVHDDLDSEWIAATAPGAPPMILPDGYAKLIPAGAKLIFQMHYTPNGTAQQDMSEIGLIFADPDSVKKRVYTQQAHNARFRIPAGEANHRVRAFKQIRGDVELMAMFPHMHFRGKSFKFELRDTEGETETLLDVTNYDFNWQNSYVLAKPLQIKKDSMLRCYAVFDNSAGNLANPDPSESVRWGDQTWEEMMIGYFDVAVPVDGRE